MNLVKRVGVGILGVSLSVGLSQAQEPVMNIQAPATAPILESEPVLKETPPVETNAPVHKEAHIAAHVATNVPTHVPVHVAVTNAPVEPAVAVVATHTNAIVPAPVVVVPEINKFFVDTWKDPSFQVGTRMLQVKLQDKTRGKPSDGSYFGTITRINEKQDNAPDKVYLQYRLFDSPVWFGVSYDHVTAHTQDDLSLVPDGSGSDGDEEITGFTPYLQAAWDNQTRFTPFAEAGYAFYQAKFVPNSWGNNGQRWVDAKSSVSGIELGGGLNVRLYKNLSADIFAKYVKVDDITGSWYYNYGNNYGGPFIMTMSYVAYGAGLSCRF